MAEVLTVAQEIHKSPATPDSREKGRAINRSIRNTLSQAAKLKDLSFQAAMDMATGFESDEEAERSRARAQAITALTKSWAESCNVMRVVRGKPLPGSLRPESKPKRGKSKVMTFTESKPE